MTDNLPTLPQGSCLQALQSPLTPEQRAQISYALIEKIEDPRFARPVVRFLTELPNIGEDDEVQLRIAAQLFTADDPDKVQGESQTIASKDITGKAVTVYDVKAAASDQEKGPGGYLLCDVTIGDDPDHKVVNCGAPQAMVRLARAYATGELPLKGSFAGVAGTGRKGNPVVTFLAESDF